MEIEGKFSLREKEVPKVRWKGCINAGQDYQEVVLERMNGALHQIAVRIHVWRDKLEGGVPLEGDCFFISGAGFVIQDLEINGEPLGRQTSHDSVVGCDAVAVTLGLMRLSLAWKAIVTYWFLESALTGKRPVLLVKSLLSSFATTKTLGWKALQREDVEPLEAPAKLAWVLLAGHFDVAGQDGP